jgi:predicted nucleic acid-binding protein
MRIYLDNCCFNRPFDDQSQLRVRLEAEAKLEIQEEVLAGTWQLVWSCVLEYENSQNPFEERREQIAAWRAYAEVDQDEDRAILQLAKEITQRGVKSMDALHVACAVYAGAAHFLTTDDIILKSSSRIPEINVVDPIGFTREMML